MIKYMLTALLLCLPCAPNLGAQDDVKITEILAFNSGELTDSDGDSPDFIELTNNASQPVDLGGWHLTDTPKQLSRWTLPPTLLQPGERLIVFASKKDRSLSGAELHTNFRLRGDGEYLALVRPDGVSIAHDLGPKFPAQLMGTSYGLGIGQDGQPLEGYFRQPTPGAANGVCLPRIAPVDFGVPRGFLEEATSVSLSCATPGVDIYFTLDGSQPGVTSGQRYLSPISVDRTLILRAQAFFSDGRDSVGASATSTYLFAEEVLAQTDAQAQAMGFPGSWQELDGSTWSNASRPGASYGLDPVLLAQYSEAELVASLKSVPSISLVMPLEDWFGYDPNTESYGIYVNPKAKGKSWTRAASAEFIDPSGDHFGINCGVKTQGSSGGNDEVRSQLSLELRFDGRFGPANLKHKLFPGSKVKNFDRLILDAGNQNSIHSPDESTSPVTYPKRYAQGLRDAFMMDLQRAMGSTTSFSRPVHVYLNGLYWGLYNLHERPDQHWSSQHFGGSEDHYDEVRDGVVRDGNRNPAIDPVNPGAWAQAESLRQAGLGDPLNYAAFSELIDLRDYARYLLLNIWAGNREFSTKDWYASGEARKGPGLGTANPRPGFKFHSWDGESVLFWGPAVTAVGEPRFDRSGARGSVGTNSAYFLSALKFNADFPLLLADEAHAQLFNQGALWVDPSASSAGTPYDPTRPERNPAATLYARLAQGIEAAVVMEYARWGNYFHSPGEYTPQDWQVERDRLLEDYFPVRSAVVLAQLRNAGLYPLLDAPVFAQQGGRIDAGFRLSMSAPPGSSIYYTLDGSDPRRPGGSIGGTLYQGPVALTSTLNQVKSRSFDGSQWSALNEASFRRRFAVAINEVMANNQRTLADEAGEYDDWIELINQGPELVDLSGHFLTDDPGHPTRWPFPAGTRMAPGECLVLWADKDTQQGPLHTNFKLSSKGEQLFLYGPPAEGGRLLMSVRFGPQDVDESHGLREPGTPRGKALIDLERLGNPSPNRANRPGLESKRP